MTEREIEQAYTKMTESDAPDLWGRIEANLSERIVAEKEGVMMKRTFFGKLKHFLFGGGTFRTAAALCLLCIIIYGAFQPLGNMFRMGGESKSSNMAADMSAPAEAEKYSADGAGGTGYFGTEEMAEVEEGVTTETGAGSEELAESQTDRKLIRNIYLDVETLEFDTLVRDIQKQTDILGGYVERSSVSGNSYYYDNTRYADLTLRIPKDKTDEFLEKVGSSGNITSRSEDVEDITLTYVDTESHVKALRTEENQLLKILEKAETVEDIMSIQSRLSEVRYQLESYASRLKTYDNQVDYDTITLYVREVTKETPTEELSIWQQMKEGFTDSLIAVRKGFRDVCIWFVAHIPYFIVLFAVVLAVTAAVKKHSKKKNIKNN